MTKVVLEAGASPLKMKRSLQHQEGRAYSSPPHDFWGPPNLGGGGSLSTSLATWSTCISPLPKLSNSTLPALWWVGNPNQQQTWVTWPENPHLYMLKPCPYFLPAARRKGTWYCYSLWALTMPRTPRMWPQRDHLWWWGHIRMTVQELSQQKRKNHTDSSGLKAVYHDNSS